MSVKETFPADGKFSRVNGLLRLLFHNKGRLQMAMLESLTNEDLTLLLPQVHAAEMLKLVRISNDDIIITELGKSLNYNDEDAIEKVAEQLKKYEPFKTAYKLSQERKKFTTEELSEILAEKNITFHLDKEKNMNIIKNLLFQWGIYFGIIDYLGINDVWIQER